MIPLTRAVSRVAVGLGALAVLPFAAGAALVWVGDAALRGDLAFALSAYAAVVISFIGAIHWGLAFARAGSQSGAFVWGVVPSLVAWAALLVPPRFGLVVEAAALIGCYVVDRVTYPRHGVAAWLPLRRWLTVFATLACALGAARCWT